MFALFEKLTNWMWGLPLLITILVTGIYLTDEIRIFPIPSLWIYCKKYVQ